MQNPEVDLMVIVLETEKKPAQLACMIKKDRWQEGMRRGGQKTASGLAAWIQCDCWVGAVGGEKIHG